MSASARSLTLRIDRSFARRRIEECPNIEAVRNYMAAADELNLFR